MLMAPIWVDVLDAFVYQESISNCSCFCVCVCVCVCLYSWQPCEPVIDSVKPVYIVRTD